MFFTENSLKRCLLAEIALENVLKNVGIVNKQKFTHPTVGVLQKMTHTNIEMVSNSYQHLKIKRKICLRSPLDSSNFSTYLIKFVYCYAPDQTRPII